MPEIRNRITPPTLGDDETMGGRGLKRAWCPLREYWGWGLSVPPRPPSMIYARFQPSPSHQLGIIPCIIPKVPTLIQVVTITYHSGKVNVQKLCIVGWGLVSWFNIIWGCLERAKSNTSARSQSAISQSSPSVINDDYDNLQGPQADHHNSPNQWHWLHPTRWRD